MQINNGQFRTINDTNRQCRTITDNAPEKCCKFALELRDKVSFHRNRARFYARAKAL